MPEVGRDLLYLAPAGAAQGLGDPQLGELLERDAPERPMEVIAEVEKRPPDTQVAVALVLAELSYQHFGDEQANVITALMGASAALARPPSAVVDPIVASLSNYVQQQGELRDEHLVEALRLDRLAHPTERSPLTERLFADDRLLRTHERVKRVALMADRLAPSHCGTVAQRAGSLLHEGPDVLFDPLRELPDEAAAYILDDAGDGLKRFIEARQAEQGDEAAREVVEEITELAEARRAEAPKLLYMVAWWLISIDTPSAYELVRDMARDTSQEVTDQAETNAMASRAVRRAPPADWAFWTSLLGAPSSKEDFRRRYAAEAAGAMFSGFRDAPTEIQAQGPELLGRLRPFVEGARSKDVDGAATALRNAINAGSWWSSGTARETQEALHASARAVFPLGGTDGVESVLVEDIRRSLPAQVGQLFEDALAGVRNMGCPLSAQSIGILGEELSGVSAPSEGMDAALTHTRLALARAAHSAGLDIWSTPMAVDHEAVLGAAGMQSATGDAAVRDWLALDPTADQVYSVVAALGQRTTRFVIDALEQWSGRQAQEERTRLVGALVQGSGIPPAWIEAVSQREIDEGPIVDGIVEAIGSAPRSEDRSALVEALVAVRPTSPHAQRRVADAITGLLDRGQGVDFKIALRALPALGDRHQSKGRLREAFVAARDERGRRIPPRAVDDLRRAGIDLPKKTFKDSAWDLWKSFLRV